LEAFATALPHVRWNAAAMAARANEGYVVATDVADALIERGVSARQAHSLVGALVDTAEREKRPLRARDLTALARSANLKGPLAAPLDALASVRAKKTLGSTNPAEISRALAELERRL
jgi:argininosuccinate lyase